jgi:type I restriction enzyme S subunit
MRWAKQRLGDIAYINPKPRRIPQQDELVSFAGMADLIAERGCIEESILRPYSEVCKGYTSFQADDILVAKITPCFENCKIGMASIPTDVGYGSTEFHVIRPLDARLDKRYTLHFLRQKKILLSGERRMTGSAGQRRVPASFLEELEIPLPPLEEQRRIAAILDKGHAIQTLIDRREKVCLAVEESLFAALGEEGRATKSSRIFDFAEVFWLQEGPGVRNWQFTTEGVKLLNVGNITPDGRLDLQKTNRHISAEEAFGRYGHFLVDEGDLLMPSSGIPIDEDGFLRTRSAFASVAHLPLCMNTSTIRFKPKMEGSSLLFLQGWLQSREFRAQITKLVTGSAQKNFGPSHLKQLQITLPEPGAQSEFEEKLNKIRNLRASLSPSVDEAERLIGSVAHHVFAGGEHE